MQNKERKIQQCSSGEFQSAAKHCQFGEGIKFIDSSASLAPIANRLSNVFWLNLGYGWWPLKKTQNSSEKGQFIPFEHRSGHNPALSRLLASYAARLLANRAKRNRSMRRFCGGLD